MPFPFRRTDAFLAPSEQSNKKSPTAARDAMRDRSGLALETGIDRLEAIP